MAQPEPVLSTRKLEGKVAIVTGGANGIGEATARVFADHGARAVVIVDIQDEKGRGVAESIGSQRCSYVHCDVSDEEQVKGMIDWTIQKYGQLDIMFSNAGIGSKSPQTILDLDVSQFDRLFEVNVRGMAICVKHAARVMVERHIKGTIVCTASAIANNCRGSTNVTDYTMSKHAILGLVRSASQQLGTYGIRINSVLPAAVPSSRRTNEEIQKTFGPFTRLKDISLTVKHIADTVLFLASNDSAFVTGHDLVVDGGLISVPNLTIGEK
ncbi:Short-chain dehydrogenase reductase 3a [Abeliophyllum distichum]|uniref:Short-chain dehydrogenase reductase 3a n=1 Tax=Abeliophyllum distichum TaxID=126358 RepID=A0ABD1VQG8_9LAMI